MSRKYPCLDHIGKKIKDPNAICDACDNRACVTMWVQYSYMRGEDESFKACYLHADMVKSDIMKFLRLCESRLVKS